MFQDSVPDPPQVLDALAEAAARKGFDMACDARTGALLRTLAAGKPGGRILELGTGVGAGAAWLLEGMDRAARLVTVERDEGLSAVARRMLGSDPRVTFIEDDGEAWLRGEAQGPFDLIFADTWPGKFTCFEEAWALLPVGAFYVVDDLLPQASWPDGHAAKVERLLAALARRTDCRLLRLAWSSGLIVAVRVSP